MGVKHNCFSLGNCEKYQKPKKTVFDFYTYVRTNMIFLPPPSTQLGLAGNVGCHHVGQRPKKIDMKCWGRHVGDILADIDARISPFVEGNKATSRAKMDFCPQKSRVWGYHLNLRRQIFNYYRMQAWLTEESQKPRHPEGV